jgi:peptidyl-prolyl cis-trans isomerase SurA
VAARVNHISITNLEIDQELLRRPRLILPLQDDNPAGMLAPLRAQALQDLINRALLHQAALHSRALEESEIGSLSSALILNYVSAYGGEAEFTKHLARRGISLEDFKRELSVDLLIEAYISKELTGDIKASKADIEDFLRRPWPRHSEANRLRLRQIQIDVSPSKMAEQPAREAALAIYDQALQPGADFKALAGKHSQSPDAKDGGDTGAFSAGEVIPEFEEAVKSLAPGEISRPFRTRYGFHLAEMEKIRETAGSALEASARREATKRVLGEKLAQALERRIQELRQKASIVILSQVKN